MNIPNFSELLKINQSLAKVDLLSNQLVELKTKLAELELKLSADIETEKYRLTQAVTQQKLLEKISLEIEELRRQEALLASQLSTKIDTAIESFFAQGDFGNFVQSLIEKLQSDGRQTSLAVSSDVAYLVTNINESLNTSGQIRLTLGDKTYILDPHKVKQELRSRLLIAVLKS